MIIDLEALRGLESQLDACHCFGKIPTLLVTPLLRVLISPVNRGSCTYRYVR